MDIDDFEARYHVAFPTQYRDFLLKFNGGRPELNTFEIQGLENSPEGAVQIFYAIRDPIESCSLKSVFDLVRPSLPDELIPIASDGGGDQICLAWYGTWAGHVFFWHFHDMPHDPDWDDVYPVAESFDAFFKGLRCSLPTDAIDLMLRSNNVSKLRALLDAGYDTETTNEFNRTLLEEAAINNRPDMIQILFDRGAKLRAAMDFALQNLEFYPEHQHSVTLLEKLSKLRPD